MPTHKALMPTRETLFFAVKSLQAAGLTCVASAANVGVPLSTVARWRARDTPPTWARKPPPATRVRELARRRRTVTKLARRTVTKTRHRGKTERSQKIVEEYREFPSAPAIRAALCDEGFVVSVSTVKRDLAAQGFRVRAKPKRPVVVEGDLQEQRAFARKLNSTRSALVRKIVFTDEKCAKAETRVRKREWVQTGDRPLRLAYDQAAARVQFWGAVGFDRKLLVEITGSTQDHHIATLTKALPLLRGRILQQDNYKPHHTQRVRDFLNANGVHTVESTLDVKRWPVRSPEVSPIEHVWAAVGRRVEDRHPITDAEVRECWLDEWEKLPQSFINGLCAKVPEKFSKLAGVRAPRPDRKRS